MSKPESPTISHCIHSRLKRELALTANLIQLHAVTVIDGMQLPNDQVNARHIVCGANSQIAISFIEHILSQSGDLIIAFSRSAPPETLSDYSTRQLQWHSTRYDEKAIKASATLIEKEANNQNAEKINPIRSITVFNGQLHGDRLNPEKALSQLTRENLQRVFEANTYIPINWIKELTKKLDVNSECVITALGARVGSISDNQLGGWHSYRSSKAALNMLLKNLAIELSRKAPGCKVISFHPGTTKSPLSKPFQKNVASDKLFDPTFVAEQLYTLINQCEPNGKLDFVDWQHQPIDW